MLWPETREGARDCWTPTSMSIVERYWSSRRRMSASVRMHDGPRKNLYMHYAIRDVGATPTRGTFTTI